MAHTYKTLCDDVEAVFLATTREHSFLSNSIVQGIAELGRSFRNLVPANIDRVLEGTAFPGFCASVQYATFFTPVNYW